MATKHYVCQMAIIADSTVSSPSAQFDLVQTSSGGHWDGPKELDGNPVTNTAFVTGPLLLAVHSHAFALKLKFPDGSTSQCATIKELPSGAQVSLTITGGLALRSFATADVGKDFEIEFAYTPRATQKAHPGEGVKITVRVRSGTSPTQLG